MYTTYTIQPLQSEVVDDESNPIIPVVAKGVFVTNSGNTELEIVSYWAPPSHIFYPIYTYNIAPGDTIYVAPTSSSFYYYRVVVTNKSDKINGCALVLLN